MQFTDQHNEIRHTISQFVEKEINPYVEEWEEYGGLGFDYSYAMVALEEYRTSIPR